MTQDELRSLRIGAVIMYKSSPNFFATVIAWDDTGFAVLWDECAGNRQIGTYRFADLRTETFEQVIV